MTNTVKVLLFAQCKECVGKSEVDMPLAVPTAASEVLDALIERFPGLETYKRSMMMAVNQEYATDETVVRPGDEVALVPPVSGG